MVEFQTLPIAYITASSLSLAYAPSVLTLNWPAWTNGQGLYASASLGANVLWIAVNTSPVATNGINLLRLPMMNSQAFFHLQFP